MADIQLIRELTDAFGPSGFEEEVCRVIYRHTQGISGFQRCDVQCLYEEEGLFREKAGGYAGCASGRMRIYGAVDP